MPSRTPSADDGRAQHGDVTGPLGLILPTYPQHRPVPGSAELAQTARRAELAGAGALWACDHLFWHSPSVECLSAIAVAATATESAAVGSCVLQLPLRNSPEVAKQAASLQNLSGGRLVLGVGIGTHRGEYQASGVCFEDRAARLDRGIDEIRRAWSSAHSREHYRQLPAPARTVPVWVGGSSEAAIRRSARRGDGWIPLFLGPAEYSAALQRLDKEADRAGRDPADIHRAIVVFVTVGGPEVREKGLEWMSSLYSLAPSAFRRHLVSGSAAQAASELSRLFEAGAQHVAAFFTSDDPITQFEDLAGELDGLIARS